MTTWRSWRWWRTRIWNNLESSQVGVYSTSKHSDFARTPEEDISCNQREVWREIKTSRQTVYKSKWVLLSLLVVTVEEEPERKATKPPEGRPTQLKHLQPMPTQTKGQQMPSKQTQPAPTQSKATQPKATQPMPSKHTTAPTGNNNGPRFHLLASSFCV